MPATNIHSILKHLTNPSLATCLLWFFSIANSAGSCKCGREGAVRQRIVGGEDSVVGSHIFVHRTPFCRVLILHLIRVENILGLSRSTFSQRTDLVPVANHHHHNHAHYHHPHHHQHNHDDDHHQEDAQELLFLRNGSLPLLIASRE